MTDDLVKRLRCYADIDDAVYHPWVYGEAADRIEKLEAALRVYADEDHWSGDTFEPIMFPEGKCKCCYEHFSDQGEIARKALEGKDD